VSPVKVIVLGAFEAAVRRAHASRAGSTGTKQHGLDGTVKALLGILRNDWEAQITTQDPPTLSAGTNGLDT
jgi:hypothetical protein